MWPWPSNGSRLLLSNAIAHPVGGNPTDRLVRARLAPVALAAVFFTRNDPMTGHVSPDAGSLRALIQATAR